MKTLEEFRKSLGPMAKEYNDAQLEELRLDMEAVAELLIGVWLKNRKIAKRK
jgi:hypothetical protein